MDRQRCMGRRIAVIQGDGLARGLAEQRM